MPEAQFSITLPSSVWIGELSRAYPETVFRVLAALPGDAVGTGLVELRGPDVDHTLSEFEAFEAVTDLVLMQDGKDVALVQFETDTPLLLFPIQETGIPLQTPFEIVDGEVTWELTASHDKLSELSTQFEAFGIPHSIDYVHQQLDTQDLLSERQAELVDTALEAGYYDTPRRTTLVELAADLDVAPSTVSETLHRAEERIIKHVRGDTRE